MRYRIVFLFILLAASILRLSALGQESFWFDELHSIQRSQPDGPLAIMAQMEFHMPLYFILLHYWMKIFPCDELHVRLLSALFGIASAAAVYWWGKALRLPKRPSLIGALLYALSPHAIYYSYEVRMYSLLPFLGHLHFALTAWVFALPRKSGVRSNTPFPNYFLISIWILVGVLVAWTHFFGVFFFIAEGLWAAVFSSRIKRIRRHSRIKNSERLKQITPGKPIYAVTFMSVVSVLSIAYFVYWLIGHTGDGAGILQTYYKMSWKTPWEVFERIINGPMIEAAPYSLRALTVLGILYLVFLSISPLFSTFRGRILSSRETRFLAPGLIALSIVCLMTGLSYWRQIILGGHRYLTIAVGPLSLAAGIGFDRLMRGNGKSKILCALIGSLIILSNSLYLYSFFTDREHPALREAAAYIMKHSQPGDYVLTRPAFDQTVVDFYTQSKIPSATWQKLMVLSPPPTNLWIISSRAPYIWEEQAFLAAGWRIQEETNPYPCRFPERITRMTRGSLRSMRPPGVFLNREEDMRTGLNLNEYVKSSRGKVLFKASPSTITNLTPEGELFLRPGTQTVQISATDRVESVTINIPIRTDSIADDFQIIDDTNRIIDCDGKMQFLNSLTPGGASVSGIIPSATNQDFAENASEKLSISVGEFTLNRSIEACGLRIRASTSQIHMAGKDAINTQYQGLSVSLDTNGRYTLTADIQFARVLQFVLNGRIRMIAAPAYYPSLAQPEIYPVGAYELGRASGTADSFQIHLQSKQSVLARLPGISVSQPVTISADYFISNGSNLCLAVLGVNGAESGKSQFTDGFGYTQLSGSSLARGVRKNYRRLLRDSQGICQSGYSSHKSRK